MKTFFTNIFTWIKTHKLSSFLIAVVAYFVLFQNGIPLLVGRSNYMMDSVSSGMSLSGFNGASGSVGIAPMMKATSSVYQGEVAPVPNISDRKVITNNSMSLQVKSVRNTVAAIKNEVKMLKGYVVNVNVYTPEFGESGSMSVRIPTTSLEDALTFFRGLAIKVVSEDTSSADITDQFVDYQARLERLYATRAVFEDMLNKATTVDEILRVQTEIFNQQSQIDSIIGQMKYLDGASSTTLISLNLATDELGLPITPVKSWRPEIVFKQAYRSMMSTLIDLGGAAIWLIVYLPLVIGAFAVFIVVKRLFIKR